MPVTLVNDTFTDSDGVNLDAHTGELGATWTRHATIQGRYAITSNRAYPTVAGLIYASGAPVVADQEVEAVIRNLSNTGVTAVAVRIQTGANTAYYCYHDGSTNVWVLAKVVAGSVSILPGGNSFSQSWTVGTDKTVLLRAIGNTISLDVDGASVYSISDSSITAAGRFGLRATGAVTTTTGRHVDSFVGRDYSTVPGRFSGYVR